MLQSKLSGAGAAMITPFTADGRVDYEALARMIDYVIEGGVDYIVALGTTAETPTLYMPERAVIAMFITNQIAGRVPLVMGCGGNSTSEVLDQLREFDLRGADAILSVTPYYNKPSQEGLYQHFRTVSEHSPLPVILYNIPGRAGVNMTAETTACGARRSTSRATGWPCRRCGSCSRRVWWPKAPRARFTAAGDSSPGASGSGCPGISA